MDRDYKITIMFGGMSVSQEGHIWLDVSDNTSRWIYEMWYPSQDFELYEGLYRGHPISYRELLGMARRDT